MKYTNFDIGVFGTFGQPNGFNQASFYNGKFDKSKSLDLNSNAIKIFPNATVFAIKREIVNNEPCLIYAIYTFATEKNSSRGGTFVGSCISFYNSYTNSNQVFAMLTELHKLLITNPNNIQNATIKVEKARNFEVKIPRDFDKLNLNLEPLGSKNFFGKELHANNNFFVFDSNNSEDRIVRFFQNCTELFLNSETIYYSQNKEVAQFVHEKGLLKISTYDDFESAVEMAKIKKKQTEHQKNNQNTIKRQQQNNKISKNQKPEITTKTNNSNIEHKKVEELQNVSENNLEEPKPKTKNYYKKGFFYIILPILCTLLICSNIYFAFFKTPKIVEVPVVQDTISNNIATKYELNPITNTFLTPKDKSILFKNKFKDKSISEIIDLIYKNNPTEISNIYNTQKKEYQNNLFELNKTYFKIVTDTICLNDSIEKIPSFKRK